jgi:hypothetical protein
MAQLKSLVIIFCVTLPFYGLKAQTKSPYTYQQLSKKFYEKQKDSLKKAWTCPNIYSNKATQKKYKEIWESRTDFITSAIETQNYVYEPELFNYIQDIIKQLARASPHDIPVLPLILIDRSSSPNAYAIGGNVLAVNLGLIYFAKSREEIALAIAHELSHNILNHAENAMKGQAEWLTSAEYKNSLNSVLKSKYERLTRLKRIYEGYTFNRSKHQRYRESNADSLAIILLKKSKIHFDAAFFLQLDSADIQYKQPLKKTLKDYFAAYNLPVEALWTQKRSKGLSSRNYNFKDTTGVEDSLKTHPDCIERYKRTVALSDKNIVQRPIPANIKEKTTKMLIWNIYSNMDLTACLYRILQEKDKGNVDVWYDFMMYNVFAGLCFNDRELHRFNAIGITPKEYISKDYYQLQNMLEQMPKESLQQYFTALQNADFWKRAPADEKALKSIMYTLAIDPNNSDKNRWNEADDFIKNNSTSMYREFAERFKKK